MLLLVTTGHPDMERYRHPHLGRLVQPRHYSSIERTAAGGIPWAADNDCYQGLDAKAFGKMLDRIANLPGCLFVTCPDVVANHLETTRLWLEWRQRIADTTNLPVAFVLQDGCREVPDDADAVFIGGSTEFKMGPDAERLVATARASNRHVHMGRVNTDRRIRYAAAIGCDSIDGSKWARWKALTLRAGLASVSAPPHLRMEIPA